MGMAWAWHGHGALGLVGARRDRRDGALPPCIRPELVEDVAHRAEEAYALSVSVVEVAVFAHLVRARVKVRVRVEVRVGVRVRDATSHLKGSATAPEHVCEACQAWVGQSFTRNVR